jgi:hypothetical protein
LIVGFVVIVLGSIGLILAEWTSSTVWQTAAWFLVPLGAYASIGWAWNQAAIFVQSNPDATSMFRRVTRAMAVASVALSLGYFIDLYQLAEFRHDHPGNVSAAPTATPGNIAVAIGFCLVASGFWFASLRIAHEGMAPSEGAPTAGDGESARVS